MAASQGPVISEEGGVWMVRILAPKDKRAVQEYRCATEDVARAFAARFLSARPPPPAHGAVARSLRPVDSGPWWWRRAK